MNAKNPARHRGFAALFTLLAGVVVTSTAAAQGTRAPAVEDDAAISVLTADKVYIRSGAANSYYPFGMLREGAMVKVLEEKYNWARVATMGPAFEDLFGYIKQMNTDNQLLRLNADGTRGVTLGRVNLVAANLETGNSPQHSWKPIAHLDPDREVTVLRTIESDSQTIYAVSLPGDASGWVSMAHLRDADDAELRKWKQLTEEPKPAPKTAGDGKLAPQQPQPASADVTPVQDTVLARQEPIETPHISAPQIQRDDAARPVAKPQEQTESVPSDAKSTSPDMRQNSQPVTSDAANDPAMLTAPTHTPDSNAIEAPAVEQSPVAEDRGDRTNELQRKTEPKAANPRTPTERLNALEGAFIRLREEPIETAEVNVLRELFVELSTDPKAERQVEMYSRSRAEQLRIWSELQVKRRELKLLRSQLEVAGEDVQAVKYSLQTSGSYTAVGRIAASTVYDGTQLPRLYRIQDPATGRTIAYIRPQKKLDLTGMLDQLVGVIGEKAYDGSLRLNIIDPERIDLLAPQPEQAAGANAASGG